MTSAPQTVTVRGRTYVFVPDRVARRRALVTGRVRDAAHGEQLAVPFALAVDGPPVRVAAPGGGVFALAAPSDVALLGAPPLAFELTASARGYRPASLSVSVPAPGGTPVDAGAIDLLPLPVTLRGTAVEDVAGHPPVAGAAVAVGAPGIDVAALRQPLALARDAGPPDGVRACALAQTGGAKTVTAPARAGAETLELSSRTGFASGGLLALGPPERREYAPVSGLEPPGGSASDPGAVRLARPLTLSHAAGAPARKASASPSGATRRLLRPALPGDGLLALDGPVSGAGVEVSGPAGVEHHDVGLVSDADGRFQLAGVTGVAELRLELTHPGFATAVLTAAIDYGRTTNAVGVRLTATP